MTNAAGTWVALLLAERSPSLRWLVLRELLGRADDDPEVQELASLREGERLVADLWALQAEDGSWKGTDLGKASAQPSGWATAHALMRLGYLDLDWRTREYNAEQSICSRCSVRTGPGL
jgi:hypothetical protein